MAEQEIAWAIEGSKDGQHWRFIGKGWAGPGEPLFIHGAPQLLRFRRVDSQDDWCVPLERQGDHPMTLLRLEKRVREELWPGDDHVGLPVLLPGGEEGRLLRFEHSEDGNRWTWALEFRGKRH